MAASHDCILKLSYARFCHYNAVTGILGDDRLITRVVAVGRDDTMTTEYADLGAPQPIKRPRG